MQKVGIPLSPAGIASALELVTASISNPTELNALGTAVPDWRLVRTNVAASDEATLYRLDTSSDAVAAPYVMASATVGLRWVAISGRYQNDAIATAGALSVAGIATSTNTTQSISNATGALTLTGGLGILVNGGTTAATSPRACDIECVSAGSGTAYNRLYGAFYQSLLSNSDSVTDTLVGVCGLEIRGRTSGTATAPIVHGVRATTLLTGSGAVTTAYGGFFQVSAFGTGTSTVGTATALYAQLELTNGTSLTVPTAVGLQIANAGGTVTNSYGILIGNIANGATGNFAIATGSGKVTIGDTTSASSAIAGAVVIGNGTAATSVAIGGGNVNAGATITSAGRNTASDFRANSAYDGSVSQGFVPSSLTLTVTPTGNVSTFQEVSLTTLSCGSAFNYTDTSFGQVAIFGKFRHSGSGTIAQANCYQAFMDFNSTGTLTDGRGFQVRVPALGAGPGILTSFSAFYSDALTAGYFLLKSAGSGLVSIGDTTEATAIGTAGVVTASGLSVAKRSFLGTIGSTFKGNVIAGVQDATAAAVGQVGEVLSATQSTYTNYTTTATYQQVTTVSLTAGDWDIVCFGTLAANGSTLTVTANSIFTLSTTTASATGTTEGAGDIAYVSQVINAASGRDSIVLHKRVNINATTSYFLNSQSTFTLGNPQFVGSIVATRIR